MTHIHRHDDVDLDVDVDVLQLRDAPQSRSRDADLSTADEMFICCGKILIHQHCVALRDSVHGSPTQTRSFFRRLRSLKLPQRIFTWSIMLEVKSSHSDFATVWTYIYIHIIAVFLPQFQTRNRCTQRCIRLWYSCRLIVANNVFELRGRPTSERVA